VAPGGACPWSSVFPRKRSIYRFCPKHFYETSGFANYKEKIMAKSTAKAESIIRQLKDNLSKRIAGAASGRLDTIREAKDSDGYPYLMLSDGGTETAGNPVAFIRVKQSDAVSKDILGNSLMAFAPHILELAYELDGANSELLPADQQMLMWEIAPIGCNVQVKQIADATAVTAANVDAAAVAVDLDSIQWPTKGA
jgi:hypothetical protein